MYEKSIPELNKKRCLKTDANKSKNTKKMTPKSVPKDDFISGVAPLGAPLVALTAFGHQKLAPKAPKVPRTIEKSTKNDTKEPPECEKTLKVDTFRIQARRTARSAYNYFQQWDFGLGSGFHPHRAVVQKSETTP